jgi:hypothetical protein
MVEVRKRQGRERTLWVERRTWTTFAPIKNPKMT